MDSVPEFVNRIDEIVVFHALDEKNIAMHALRIPSTSLTQSQEMQLGVEKVELDALLALRAQLNDAAPVKKTDKGEVPAYKLSVNDMVIKALALAVGLLALTGATDLLVRTAALADVGLDAAWAYVGRALTQVHLAGQM